MSVLLTLLMATLISLWRKNVRKVALML